MTMRLVLLAGGVAAAAIAVGVFVSSLEGGPGITDTPVYRLYGERITRGEVPYRDFAVEYPPGALVPFVLAAALSSTRDGYDDAFAGLMVLALVVISLLIMVTLRYLGASSSRMASSLAAFWVGTAVLGPFVVTRFDLFAAAVTLAAAFAILHGRARLGPILLGAAIATKIYPAVLVPLLVVRTARREGRREALRGLALAVGTAALAYLPFLVLAPEGVVRSVWRQLSRPLQIESLGSAVLLALHHALGMPLGWASGSGSQNLTGAVAAVASSLTTLAGVAALGFAWVRFSRRDASSDARFVTFAAAAVVAFVAFGKVASPQFLIWLLAVVVVVPGRRGAVAATVLLAACGLTRLWFPRRYWDLVRHFDPAASWLVLVRDLLLVGLFAVLVIRLSGRPRARESGPA